MNSADPLVLGLAFLEIEPSSYQCYYDANTSENPSDEGQWQACTKDDICNKNIPKERYHADPSDPENIDNWVERYGTLCKPKSKQGLFGLYFFFGIISTIIVFPKISDMYGRRVLFIQTMAVTSFVQLGLIISDDLTTAQFLMFLLGTTFAGKCIIGLSFLIEYMTRGFVEYIVFIQLIVEPTITIMITLWYQYIDRSWLLLNILCLVISLMTLFYLIAPWPWYGWGSCGDPQPMVPESPKYKYAWRDFDETRQILREVAD